MGNLIKEMKAKIAASGSSKKELLYFGKDSVKRVRFLQELDTGFTFQFHNDWNAGILELCKDPEDHENCKLCEQGIKVYENFAWSVWDYDSNAVRIILFKASGISPIPAFIEMYEEFGTIMDRDYKIKKVGQGQGGSFVVTPLDKERFSNKKAKPYTESQVHDILEKAYAKSDVDTDDDDDDEEDEAPKKASKKDDAKKAKKKKKPSLRDQFEELSFKELKEIAIEIGISKKELKAFEDEEELLDELFDNYDEEDLQELLEDMQEPDDEDEEEEDED